MEINIGEMLKPYKGLPKGKDSSVHSSIVRTNKAEEQAMLAPVELKEIIAYTKDF